MKAIFSIGIGVLFSTSLQALPTLSFYSWPGKTGDTVNATLHISELQGTAISGINARLALPEGASVATLSAGSLLTDAGGFVVDWSAPNDELALLAYSRDSVIDKDGEVLQLQLTLSSNMTPGVHEVAFATINPAPMVNSRHAIAATGGTSSLDHSVVDGRFLVYSDTSDYDGDQIPDAWEIAYGLNPYEDDANLDKDGDLTSNLDEYYQKTDPTDPYNGGSVSDLCGSDYVLVENTQYFNQESVTCNAAKAMFVRGEVVIWDGATVNYSAPSITISPNFHAMPGASVRLIAE